MAPAFGQLPTPTNFLEKRDQFNVRVTPATKQTPIPTGFFNLEIAGKKVSSGMMMVPGRLWVPWSEDGTAIKYNKVMIKATGPDESEHPAAERFAREFAEFREFTDMLEEKIRAAVAANPISFFKKTVDPSCITVISSVEDNDQYGASIAAKFNLLDKGTRENFPASNIDTAFLDVVRKEEGVEFVPLALNEVRGGDVMAFVTSGAYLTFNIAKNPLDGKTTGLVRMHWPLTMAYRVGKGGKRRGDDSAAGEDAKALWQSDAAKDMLGGYL